ncbi:MAG TPA: hypothetical protein VIV64_04335 [Gammaproteobacteria bacterium]|jgi:hypothetical protein
MDASPGRVIKGIVSGTRGIAGIPEPQEPGREQTSELVEALAFVHQGGIEGVRHAGGA